MASIHNKAETRCVRWSDRPIMPSMKAVLKVKYVGVIQQPGV